MTDIVEKLRAGVCKPSTGCLPTDCACAWMDTAADEIERLRELASYLTEERRILRVEAGYD